MTYKERIEEIAKQIKKEANTMKTKQDMERLNELLKEMWDLIVKDAAEK